MMLTMRLKRDILQQDNLVITADLLERAVEVDSGILVIAARIFLPRPRHPRRRIEQPLAARVVARPADQGPHRLGNLVRNRDLGHTARLSGPSKWWPRQDSNL